MGVDSEVGSASCDPALLAQAIVRKTTPSPIISPINLIWPVVLPVLFAMDVVSPTVGYCSGGFGLVYIMLGCIIRHNSETRKYP